MKSFTLAAVSFVALVAASSAMAAPNVPPTPTGPAPAPNGTNYSDVQQIGNNVVVEVDQILAGATRSNYSLIKQDDGSGNAGSNLKAVVNQNTDAGSHDNVNISEITQKGFDSYARVQQNGTNNKSTSLVTQRGFASGAQERVYVDQYGDDNTNWSWVNQNGREGLIDVDQHGVGNNNVSYVSQAGFAGQAYVNQH